jgi:hypothetical protein
MNSMEEIWKDIEGLEGKYQVSNQRELAEIYGIHIVTVSQIITNKTYKQ